MASEEDEVRALLTRHREQIIRDFHESELLSILIRKGVLSDSNERILGNIQCDDSDQGDYGKLADSPSSTPFIEHLSNGAVTNSADNPSRNEIDEKKCSYLIDVISKNGFEKFKEFCYAIETECPQLIEDLINDRLNGGK